MITRSGFVDSLIQSNADIDVTDLDPEMRSSLAEVGLSMDRLRSIAGHDGMIATRSEYHRLFDLLDDLDQNGSRHSIAETVTLPNGEIRQSDANVARIAILQRIEDHRLRTHLGTLPAVVAGTRAPWLSIVKGELGQKEVKGVDHNSRILEYHASTRLGASKDETPWCSSFVNWVMEKAGISGTNSAAALSWLKWGREISSPAVGAIAVINWGDKKGHVGFVVGKSGDHIVLAGGNQRNEVNYSTYRRDQIASFRVPEGYEVPAQDRTLPSFNVRMANENLTSTR